MEDGAAVRVLVQFLWFTLVVGFFSFILDFTQFARYSAAFPGYNFSMVALAGIIGVIMFVCSLLGALSVRKGSHRLVAVFMGAATVCAFLLGFLHRVPLGTGRDPVIYQYLGGLGTLAVVMLLLSRPKPQG